jgi:U3 small nucleolar RNA-associated protein 22
MQVDPAAALRAVDTGPSADQAAAAAAFRAFWGERAELRRFADGQICEAVVWEVGPAERHLVLDR